MKDAGIYYALNDGLKWQRADAKLVAAAADDGLYVSRNSAASFEQPVKGQQVLAASFDLDGKQLWFSA